MGGDPFYYSRPWRQCRGSFLKHNPMCQEPGCEAKATVVDHKISRRRGGAPFDPGNLQSLCATHHNRKSAVYDGGFGRKPWDGSMACDNTGQPLAHDHPWNADRAKPSR